MRDNPIPEIKTRVMTDGQMDKVTAVTLCLRFTARVNKLATECSITTLVKTFQVNTLSQMIGTIIETKVREQTVSSY